MLLKTFGISLLSLLLGVLGSIGFVWWQTANLALSIQAGITAIILAVLEISLSFDNAVVNATVIKNMDAIWRKRFLTWGILIAVFGMRLIFPLAIVSIIAKIDPWAAFMMSISDPAEYARIMTSAHLTVSSFGGMFLFMVFVHYFVNDDKDEHWISWIERPLARLSQFRGVEFMVSLVVLLSIASLMDAGSQLKFLVSGLWGVITFLAVHSLSDWLESMDVIEEGAGAKAMMSSGLGLFIYLEVLDASFSFDGVIGAFAITQSLIQIMIGLGIGAFFVRSLTIYFVEQETLDNFKYLEHGAFYALGSLSLFMLLDYFFHFPEWITGLTGAVILVISVFWSIHVDRKSRA